MPVQFIVTLRGHPYDLWGLSRIFDGTNTDHTLIKAEQPKGRPTVDMSKKEEFDRYHRLGFDTFAVLTCDTLIHKDEDGPPDTGKMRDVARDVIARINGIGRWIEPDYWPVALHTIEYKNKGGSGMATGTAGVRNKQHTSLGWHHSHATFADRAYELSRAEPAVRFVLDAIALPTTWASLYLIYETIKSNVGDQKSLEQAGWIPAQDLSDFRYAANHSRTLSEGMRHATAIPHLPKAPIPLHQARSIIDRLAKAWVSSLG